MARTAQNGRNTALNTEFPAGMARRGRKRQKGPEWPFLSLSGPFGLVLLRGQPNPPGNQPVLRYSRPEGGSTSVKVIFGHSGHSSQN